MAASRFRSSIFQGIISPNFHKTQEREFCNIHTLKVALWSNKMK